MILFVRLHGFEFIPRYPRGSSDTFMVFRHIGRAGFACAGQGKKPPGKNGRDAANRLEDQRQLCCGVGRRNSAAELPQSLNFFKFFGEREKRTRTKREQSQAKCALGCQTSCSEAISGNSLMRREQHSTTSCGHGVPRRTEERTFLTNQKHVELDDAGAVRDRTMQGQSQAKCSEVAGFMFRSDF